MARRPSITREQIIEVALDHFLNSGFEETTFNQIAKSLGVTQPALYSYFDNKMGLLEGCCLWAAQKVREFIDDQVDPREPAMKRLSQYIRGNLEFFRRHRREAYAMSAVYFFAQTHEKLKQAYDLIQANSLDRFEAAILQVSYERGKKIKNPRAAAELLHSLVIGEVYKVIHHPRQYKPQERETFLMKASHAIFDMD